MATCWLNSCSYLQYAGSGMAAAHVLMTASHWTDPYATWSLLLYTCSLVTGLQDWTHPWWKPSCIIMSVAFWEMCVLCFVFWEKMKIWRTQCKNLTSATVSFSSAGLEGAGKTSSTCPKTPDFAPVFVKLMFALSCPIGQTCLHSLDG